MTFSYAYTMLIDLIYKIKVDKVNDTSQTFSGNSLNVIKTGTSDKVRQEITIANDELFTLCNKHEWWVLGQISVELHYGNALWVCPETLKSTSQNRTVMGSLKKKNLIIPTETKDIYIVNPFYLRKGDLLKVLVGTAELLMDVPQVQLEHVRRLGYVKGLELKSVEAVETPLIESSTTSS